MKKSFNYLSKVEFDHVLIKLPLGELYDGGGRDSYTL